MNDFLWSIAVNCLAATVPMTFADMKAYILTQVAGDDDALEEAGTQIDDSETLLNDQAALPEDERASWYIHNLPGVPVGPTLTTPGLTVAIDTGATGTVDLTGLGDGGAVTLKSPDGTVYACTIADGGTWDIAEV